MDDRWIFNFRKRKPVEGEEVTFEEAEAFLLGKLNDPEENPHAVRLGLVEFYGEMECLEQAMRYAEEYLAESTDPLETAEMIFHQGQLMEKAEEWGSAVEYYRKALEMGSLVDMDRYWLHNNIGYSLNRSARFCEAEPHLREAIRLDPSRPNAFKNLGLSLEGQGRSVEAAGSYIAAVRADASDARALRHLKELVERHRELYEEIPDLEYQISKCQEAVGFVQGRLIPPAPARKPS